MQELVGRLTSLDPVATESLKVIGYFDTLVGAQAGVEALVRSAAVLAGCPAGVRLPAGRRSSRSSPEGHRLDPSGPAGWPAHDAGTGGIVWIEREGAPHANDAMLLERFAIAVGITEARTRGDSAVHRAAETVVDPEALPADRAAAVARLRLQVHRSVRAVAVPAATLVGPGRPTTVIATPHGLARLVLIAGEETWRGSVPAGLGPPVDPDRLPESWDAATIALRLTTEAEPVVDAAGLGALLLLARAADAAGAPHPDVLALEALADDPHALPALDALAADGSVRATAQALGLHHSTVQVRIAALADRLGYDPRTPAGRTRYALARTLLRLRATRLP